MNPNATTYTCVWYVPGSISCAQSNLFPSQIHQTSEEIANGATWQLTATHNDIVDRDEHELHRVANEAWSRENPKFGDSSI